MWSTTLLTEKNYRTYLHTFHKNSHAEYCITMHSSASQCKAESHMVLPQTTKPIGPLNWEITSTAAVMTESSYGTQLASAYLKSNISLAYSGIHLYAALLPLLCPEGAKVWSPFNCLNSHLSHSHASAWPAAVMDHFIVRAGSFLPSNPKRQFTYTPRPTYTPCQEQTSRLSHSASLSSS